MGPLKDALPTELHGRSIYCKTWSEQLPAVSQNDVSVGLHAALDRRDDVRDADVPENVADGDASALQRRRRHELAAELVGNSYWAKFMDISVDYLIYKLRESLGHNKSNIFVVRLP